MYGLCTVHAFPSGEAKMSGDQDTNEADDGIMSTMGIIVPGGAVSMGPNGPLDPYTAL